MRLHRQAVGEGRAAVASAPLRPRHRKIVGGRRDSNPRRRRLYTLSPPCSLNHSPHLSEGARRRAPSLRRKRPRHKKSVASALAAAINSAPCVAAAPDPRRRIFRRRRGCRRLPTPSFTSPPLPIGQRQITMLTGKTDSTRTKKGRRRQRRPARRRRTISWSSSAPISHIGSAAAPHRRQPQPRRHRRAADGALAATAFACGLPIAAKALKIDEAAQAHRGGRHLRLLRRRRRRRRYRRRPLRPPAPPPSAPRLGSAAPAAGAADSYFLQAAGQAQTGVILTP